MARIIAVSKLSEEVKDGQVVRTYKLSSDDGYAEIVTVQCPDDKNEDTLADQENKLITERTAVINYVMDAASEDHNGK